MSLPRRDLPARKSRSTFGSVIARLLATLVVLAVVTGALAGVAWLWATGDGPLAEDRVVNIPAGSTSQEIASTLEREGVVDSAPLTMLGISALRQFLQVEPKAGEYAFEARVPLLDVLRQLRRGKIVTYKVSIPEGFTTWQVIERLNANEVLTGEITDMPKEGELLPDTYVFTRGRTRQSIIDQMKAAQTRLMDRLWAERKSGLPITTPEEAIILASLVEKETGKADERAQVAGVFVNRLRKGMRLQSDPTIIYGITLGQGKLDRPLYRSDIREKTAYNTYQIDGLPPTPIANPGRASLEAVLNPLDTDYVYFVADGTGGHAFAVTLDEHNANVRQWRAWLKEQREAEAKEQLTDDAVAAGEEAALRPSAVPAEAGLTEDNADAPLPSGAEAEAPAAEAVPAADTATPANEEAAPASQFRTVQVDGRIVPIPVAKPARQ